MTLVHQCARPRADGNGVSLAVIGDAGVVERGQKARITVGIIAAWIGLCGRGHADYGGETCKQNKLSHRLILVQMGVVVVPTRFVGPLIPECSYELAVVLCDIEGQSFGCWRIPSGALAERKPLPCSPVSPPTSAPWLPPSWY